MAAKNFSLQNVNFRGEILHLLVGGYFLSRRQKKEKTRLEETLAERREVRPAPYSLGIRGSDTEHPDSLLPQVKGQDGGIPQKREQDKRVRQIAAPFASEGFGKWETHVAQKERKAPTPEGKRELRSVAYRMGPDLLERMSTDKEFMENIHSEIAVDRFIKDAVSNVNRRNRRIPEPIHEASSSMVKAIDKGRELIDVEGNPNFGFLKLNDDELLEASWRFALIEADSLIGKGGYHDA